MGVVNGGGQASLDGYSTAPQSPETQSRPSTPPPSSVHQHQQQQQIPSVTSPGTSQLFQLAPAGFYFQPTAFHPGVHVLYDPNLPPQQSQQLPPQSQSDKR